MSMQVAPPCGWSSFFIYITCTLVSLSIYTMEDRKEVWVQWLTFFGNMVGLPCSEDHSDDSLERVYRELCRALHPDMQPTSASKAHKDRATHFFKILNNIHDIYKDGVQDLEPPEAEAADEGVGHDTDSVPKDKGRSSNRMGHRVYLVTFSHSECEGRRSPEEFSRQQFAELLINAFEGSIPQLKVEYLAVFQERHSSGPTAASRNIHYHAAVKCGRQHLWAPVAALLRQQHKVYVHFAASGNGYHSAFRYGWFPTRHKPLEELDKEFLLVNGTEVHPSPEEAARRPAFWKRKKRGEGEADTDCDKESLGEEAAGDGTDNESSPKRGRREPQLAHVYRVMRENNLWSETALLAFARRVQDTHMNALFMRANAENLVERALHLEQAEARLSRSQQSRLDLLVAAADTKCNCEPKGEWKKMALELLHLQEIPARDFASAILRALDTGASKGSNVFIFGTTSSAKSWILDPLRGIYRCHLTPPPRSGFPLQELPSKEVILWQDFRHDDHVLPWNTLLLLFEGTEITIRRPRTEYAGDKDFTVTQPAFITSAAKLVHPEGGDEQLMMEARFNFFHFRRPVPPGSVRKVPPCASCFASLWLAYSKPAGGDPELAAAGGSSSSSSAGSSSATKFPFCGDCGLLLSSSLHCRRTGRLHL